MPTYQYECSLCGHSFCVFQSMTAEKLSTCPECHKDGLQRLIGMGAGIIFKGSGFYETDYKRKTSEKKNPKAKPDERKAVKETTTPAPECPGSCGCCPA